MTKLTEHQRTHITQSYGDEVEALAAKLVKHIEAEGFEFMGPMGLRADINVGFHSPDGVITFCRQDGETRVIDYSTNTGQYKEGTIGYLNGMNHPAREIPDDIDEITKYIVWSSTRRLLDQPVMEECRL